MENLSETAAHFPRCVRCDKPVDKVVILPIPNNRKKVTVEFECHGESVQQEVAATLLSRDEHGLASYTVFNDYTSGLLMK